MRAAFVFSLLVISTRTMSSADGDATAKELKSLAGSWTLAAAEQGGNPVPKSDLLPISFTLRPDGKSDVRVLKDEFQTIAVIDPTQSPKTIDIEYLGGLYKGQKQYGIYKIEGGRWTVFSTPPGGKPEERPQEFDSKASKGSILVWVRTKEEKK